MHCIIRIKLEWSAYCLYFTQYILHYCVLTPVRLPFTYLPLICSLWNENSLSRHWDYGVWQSAMIIVILQIQFYRALVLTWIVGTKQFFGLWTSFLVVHFLPMNILSRGSLIWHNDSDSFLSEILQFSLFYEEMYLLYILAVV